MAGMIIGSVADVPLQVKAPFDPAGALWTYTVGDTPQLPSSPVWLAAEVVDGQTWRPGAWTNMRALDFDTSGLAAGDKWFHLRAQAGANSIIIRAGFIELEA